MMEGFGEAFLDGAMMNRKEIGGRWSYGAADTMLNKLKQIAADSVHRVFDKIHQMEFIKNRAYTGSIITDISL